MNALDIQLADLAENQRSKTLTWKALNDLVPKARATFARLNVCSDIEFRGGMGRSF